MQAPINTVINNITLANCQNDGFYFTSKYPNSLFNAAVSITNKAGGNVSAVTVKFLFGKDNLGQNVWVNGGALVANFTNFNAPTPYLSLSEGRAGIFGFSVAGLPNGATASLFVTEYAQPIRVVGYGQ